MLRITAANYEMLIRMRTALRENAEVLPKEMTNIVTEFCTYVDDLEVAKEEDLKKHRESLQKWRNSPSGKVKNRIINARSMQTYIAKKKAEKAAQHENE